MPDAEALGSLNCDGAAQSPHMFLEASNGSGRDDGGRVGVTASHLIASIIGVDVRLGRVDAQLPGTTSSGVLWQAAPGRFRLEVPGVASYLALDGTSITVDVAAGAGLDEVNRFLGGTPQAAAYLQRGMPVLHAAVVAPPDGGGAIVIAGDSGSGKSTLAAALWARGFQVLADNLAPLAIDDQGSPVVLPAAGELILWPDAVDRLGLAQGHPTAYGPEGRRRRFDASDASDAGRRPVTSIWRLTTHASDDVEVFDIKGVARFEAVGTMAFNSRIASALLDRHGYMTVAGAVAASAVSMRRLERPRGRWSAGELADIIAGARAA